MLKHRLHAGVQNTKYNGVL